MKESFDVWVQNLFQLQANLYKWFICVIWASWLFIESHELMNKSYLSAINYGWKNDLMQLKATANNFRAKSLYKLFQWFFMHYKL